MTDAVMALALCSGFFAKLKLSHRRRSSSNRRMRRLRHPEFQQAMDELEQSSKLPPALLEHWMRQYYFNTKYDLGSSGVEPFSFGELRELLELTEEDLNRIVFHDSTTLGGLDIRKAIAVRWGNGDPDTVMVAHGSSEAIYLTMNVILREGDEVVVLEPCYQQLS